MKKKYVYGIELVECKCGEWKIEELPCWKCHDREQLFVESFAKLNQSIRNLGYEILKSFKLL